MDSGYPGKRFNRWTLIHSVTFLVLGVAVAALRTGTSRGLDGRALVAAVAALAVFAPVSFAALFAKQGKSSLYLPNCVSLARLAGTEFSLLGAAGLFPGGWLLFTLLAASALSDFADGLLARRMGPTPFGAKLDMELDACFTCALSICGYLLFGVGAWILSIGLMRYAYVIILLLLPPVIGLPVWYMRAAKGTCGFTVFALVLVAAPVVPQDAKAPLAASALVLLSVSFALDAAIRMFGKSGEYGPRQL